MEANTPVVVLSGFLGAGKTTLMAHILATAASGIRLGCIVNDLAKVNVDEATLLSVDTTSASNFVSLANGCVCCDGGAGFAGALEALVAGRAGAAAAAPAPPFDAILVECTGIADPAVASAAFTAAARRAAQPWTSTLALPPRIVTVVDAVAFWSQWDSSLREATGARPLHAELLSKQVEAAHAIVLNKASTLAPRECTLLHRLLTGMSRSGAAIMRTDFGRVSLEWLLHTSRRPAGPATASSLPARTALRAGVQPPAKRQRYGITSFVFESAERPFHPVRLFERVVKRLPVKSTSRDQSALADARDALAKVAPSAASGGVDAGIAGSTGDGTDGACDGAGDRTGDETRDGAGHESGDGTGDGCGDGSGGGGGDGTTAPWERLVRSKGSVWLASQRASAFIWSHAGVHFSLREGDVWPVGEAPKSTLVLIGIGLDQHARAAMEDVLTSCLLSDAEYVVYAAAEASRKDGGAADAAPGAANEKVDGEDAARAEGDDPESVD